jgi:hypothetical protein
LGTQLSSPQCAVWAIALKMNRSKESETHEIYS